MGSGNNHNQKTGNQLDTEDQEEQVHPTLSNFGARRAMNYILDIAKNRKQAVTFYWDSNEGAIRELKTGKKIEVIYKGVQEGG